VRTVAIGEMPVPLVALPLIFEQFRKAGKGANQSTASELLETVRIYNSLPDGAERACAAALLDEYAAFLAEEGATP
jgi:hypothetical protein